MRLTTMSKVNDYLMELLDIGWTVARSSHHIKLLSPDGVRRLSLPTTIKDKGTTSKNVLASCKRCRREYENAVAAA